MTELNFDEGCDIGLLHPAFFVLSEELSENPVIFSSDGERVLACSQPLAKLGEGSIKFAKVLFKKYANRILNLLPCGQRDRILFTAIRCSVIMKNFKCIIQTGLNQ